MRILSTLFDNNRAWARRISARDPQFFRTLSRQQSPRYLWIGCSDSRVPANEIVGLLPGELFVHRNVANLVLHTDLNCLSVLQYAIEVLGVEHVIVCGHYGCGGVSAVYEEASLGLIDNWLRHLRDIRERHAVALASQASRAAAIDLLCEMNVVEQVRNVCSTTIVQEAWRRNTRPLSVHGWVYGLQDGLLRDLGFTTTGPDEVERLYREAVGAVTAHRAPQP